VEIRTADKGISIGLPIAILPLRSFVIPIYIKDKLMIVPVKWTNDDVQHSELESG